MNWREGESGRDEPCFIFSCPISTQITTYIILVYQPESDCLITEKKSWITFVVYIYKNLQGFTNIHISGYSEGCLSVQILVTNTVIQDDNVIKFTDAVFLIADSNCIQFIYVLITM